MAELWETPEFRIPKILHRAHRFVEGELYMLYGIRVPSHVVICKEEITPFDACWDLSDENLSRLKEIVERTYPEYKKDVQSWKKTTHTGVLIPNFLYLCTSEVVGVLYVEFRILFPQYEGGDYDTRLSLLLSNLVFTAHEQRPTQSASALHGGEQTTPSEPPVPSSCLPAEEA